MSITKPVTPQEISDFAYRIIPRPTPGVDITDTEAKLGALRTAIASLCEYVGNMEYNVNMAFENTSKKTTNILKAAHMMGQDIEILKDLAASGPAPAESTDNDAGSNGQANSQAPTGRVENSGMPLSSEAEEDLLRAMQEMATGVSNPSQAATANSAVIAGAMAQGPTPTQGPAPAQPEKKQAANQKQPSQSSRPPQHGNTQANGANTQGSK